MVMRTHPEGTCPAGGSNVECRANCTNPFRECREDALRHQQDLVDAVNHTTARSFVVSPILVADKVIEDLAPVQHFDNIAPADPPLIERLVEQMREEGYEPDVLIHGEPMHTDRQNLSDGNVTREIVDRMAQGPMHTMRVPVGEEVRRGDAVVIDEDGIARRAEGRPIGVALEDGMVRLGTAFARLGDAVENRLTWPGMRGSGGGYSMSFAAPMLSASTMGGPRRFDLRRPRDLNMRPRGRTRDEPRYQYNERFPKEVEAKAMELLRKFMSPEQYTAFVDKANIELENKAKTHRLIINRSGTFKLLKGGQGAGIEMTSGSCRGYKYPLGDEIAAFLDWFRYRTEKLIENWECGNFGIIEKKEDMR